ncbi:MAG: hypothetical protein M3Y35_07370, partial [Actinomycetota bacterium]|nr:hypothetical protein [Actinomycetota bacterium]
MPGQALPIGSIRKARRECDGLTGTLVELFAIAEGAAQQRADLKIDRCGMDAEQPLSILKIYTPEGSEKSCWSISAGTSS